jgi:UDP-2-acetamido-2-deoxy-ribo-hexuluronate aminotransferase
MRDLLLDVNIVVDVCSARQPWYINSAEAIAKCLDNGGRLWLYSGSVQTVEYSLAKEIFRQNQGKGVSFASSLAASRDVLVGFCKDKHWLAALAGEGPVFAADDPEDEQLIHSLKRFPQHSIKLLTRDRAISCKYPELTISPEKYLNQNTAAKPTAFVDLAAQQDRIRPALEQNIHQVLHHGQFIMGPEVGELEERLCAFTASRHCISCASGTDALLMALMALNIGPGHEVITVPYTWISTAEVVALLGARPVFVDIHKDTMNMDPDQVEEAITQRTRAIMPVGIYGQCADMTRINDIAQRHGIPVIEDAAQSFGATHHGRKSCALSEIGCTSFFPSKPLGGYGDGGAIFTDDQALADKMRQIRVHGQKVKHEHPLVGINGRLDTLQAAVLLEKLKVFPGECILRREAAGRYDNLLSGLSGIQTPVIAPGNESVYAQYTILARDRDSVSKSLQEAGIPSVAYYTAPLHLQGAFSSLGHTPGDFPVAEQVAAHCLSLPMNPYLTAEEQEFIVENLRTVIS